MNFSVLNGYDYISRVVKGKVITDIENCMLIVMSGTLAILDKDNKLLKTAKCGDIVNEQVALEEYHNKIKAIAVEESVMLAIPRNKIQRFMKQESEFAFQFMQELIRKYCNIEAEADNDKTDADTDNAEEDKANNTKDTKDMQLLGDIIPLNFKGNYTTIRYKADQTQLFKKKHICPVCGNKFSTDTVKTSGLSLLKIDNDMRKIYDNIDPVYYDIVTCTSCYYSSFEYSFDKTVKSCKSASEMLSKLRELNIGFDYSNCDDIIMQYYIAIYCAKQFSTNMDLQIAKMFMRMAWIFGDCGDGDREKESLQSSLENYSRAYTHMDLSPEQDQQICMIMGEIYYKLNNFKEARNYYFKAKINRSGLPAYSRQAENRLIDIKSEIKCDT